MSLLQMIKFWDHGNSNLFMDEQYRYTSEGLTMYWRAVDAAVRFWNVALAKKAGKSKTPKQQDNTPRENSGRKNIYYAKNWQDRTTPHFQRGNSRFKWYKKS